MQITEAFVSGSLGQAVYRKDGIVFVLDTPKADPREVVPNEVQWFRQVAREVVPAHPGGLPVSIETVRTRLDEEIRFFSGLDGLLVGMDRDFSKATRQRAISRAEEVLSADDEIARRIRERILIPANTQEWDPDGGLVLARSIDAKAVSSYYELLTDGTIDRLADDVVAVVLDKLGNGIDAARKREAILRSGLLTELVLTDARADRAALSKLLFRRGDFPNLRTADPSGQILAAIIQRVEKRLGQTSPGDPTKDIAPVMGEGNEKDSFDDRDPIAVALERVLTSFELRDRKQLKGSAGDIPGIQREITWIGERLKAGELESAEQALARLINRQGQRSRALDIVKTLTAVADLARGAKHFDWTWRLLAAINQIGSPDCAAMNVQAETLRDLGRYDEALAAFEETMRRFPQDEVAPNARAETLRDLGRYDEALAAFEETMRRFPQNEVARNARAETLRDLGRYDEALAAFEETMRRFPQDEVAPNARAETLRDLGRYDEALAAFEETMRRFPQDEVARNARAETLRDLGRYDEALAAFEETMRRFPQNEVAPNARAETLRDLGRYDEALAAFEETMRRFPQNEVARNARAETLRDLGRYDEALAAFEETMRRFPQNEVARNARAETLRDLGRYDEALAAFEETMRRFPQDEVAPNARAETLRDLGRYDEALAAFEETMRRFPQDEVARNARAETLRDLGRYDEALAAFEETMRRFPQNEVAPNARAETLRDLGRYDEALAAFEETMRRFPQNEVARNARAETLRDLGRYDEALAAFEETMRRFPQDEVAPNARAETLRDLGRYDEALAAFEETMRRFPQNEVARNARAETLRDLGRYDEALAAFEETMRRFPQDEVAPTARAETLRDLGRYDEALAAFEETMRRFPHDLVARSAYACILGEQGRIEEVEALLKFAVAQPRTDSDWIAAHILAMTKLRAGRIDEALIQLDRGAKNCAFRNTRAYFESARSLAILANRRAAEASKQLELLARGPLLPREEAANIVLFQAHALAEFGEPRRARMLVESAQIIVFAVAKQRRLAAALSERYGLVSGVPASAERAQQLAGDIATLEFQLACPKLWSFRTHLARAA